MRFLMSSSIQALLLTVAFAQSPCPDPDQRLTEKEAKKILAESRWSKKTTFVEWPRVSALDQDAAAAGNPGPRAAVDPPRGYGLDKGSGIHGEKELFYSYTCRLYSALPVRQAHVRIWQADSGYDKMTPTQQRSFDQRVSPFLTADTSQDIVVSIELRSNHRQAVMEVERRLRRATLEELTDRIVSPRGEIIEQQPYLISDHLGRIPLKAYYPPSSNGTGAKLVFPRLVDGEPVVLPKDKEVKLQFLVPGLAHKLYIVWKVEELMCNGQLLL